jgi:protein-disulfide isomerase
MTRLVTDTASDEVSATRAENFKLAPGLGINGTSGYVIGDTVAPGAAGAAGRDTAWRRFAIP